MIVSIAQCLKLILYLRYLKRESRPSRNVLTNQLLTSLQSEFSVFWSLNQFLFTGRSDQILRYNMEFSKPACACTPKCGFGFSFELIRILNSCTYNGNKQDLANRQRIPGEFLISYSTRIGYNLYLQRYEIPFFVIIT